MLLNLDSIYSYVSIYLCTFVMYDMYTHMCVHIYVHMNTHHAMHVDITGQPWLSHQFSLFTFFETGFHAVLQKCMPDCLLLKLLEFSCLYLPSCWKNSGLIEKYITLPCFAWFYNPNTDPLICTANSWTTVTFPQSILIPISSCFYNHYFLT